MTDVFAVEESKNCVVTVRANVQRGEKRISYDDVER